MEKMIAPAQDMGESITITERSQLLSITPEQARKIKSLRIENQVIDAEAYFDFRDFFSLLKKLDALYFVKCQFVSFYSEILRLVDSVPIIGIVECNLSESYVEDIIWPIKDWLPLHTLDLSSNRIGEEPEKFLVFLKNEICGVVSVGSLILANNDISLNYQFKISELMKCRGANVSF